MHLHAADEPATEALARRLAARAQPGDAILLAGPLGAGKTSFARAFIRAATGQPGLVIPSPTFTLVQQYETPAATIRHFDLWRLTSHHALEELGWDEAQSGIILAEWPDRLGPLTPPDALSISFALATPAGRDITLKGPGRWVNDL
jgi:tRNA threonylcarbamoyladenosine biosynthesis protein TsaE